MIKKLRLDPPEEWGDSKVHPGMTVGESIAESILNAPQEAVIIKHRLAFLKKHNPEQYLFETRGNNNLEPNLELLDEQEKAGQ